MEGRQRYYTLQQAKRYKSKTKPYPFIVAHECHEQYWRDGQQRTRTREYYAFDDVEDFLRSRSLYPHSHEVIYERYSDTQQGRLIFDFDFEGLERYGYGMHVAPNFQSEMEKLVKETFQTFYEGVDCSRFVFVWLISDTTKKWSKHLIVKNAHFSSDWKEQSQIFYQLLLGYVLEKNAIPYMPPEELIDAQVARSNATMRMCGSSKIGGKVLELESPKDATFYDTLVQLHRREDALKEQEIYSDQLRKSVLRELETKNNRHYEKSCHLSEIDLTKAVRGLDSKDLEVEEVKDAVRLLKSELGDSTFRVRTVQGSRIDLERLIPSECPLSGRTHEAENAFLIVASQGVYFYCRRGCEKNGRSRIRLGKRFRQFNACYKHAPMPGL